MNEKRPHTIHLTDQQFEFLTGMKSEFNLPDESKVVRCLVNFASADGTDRPAIFGEIRCPEC